MRDKEINKREEGKGRCGKDEISSHEIPST